MNYNIINKDINELLNQGIGVSIPFNGNTGFNITYNTKDAIRSNLLNFLLTNKKERIFNPYLGSNIREQLFENIIENNLDDLKSTIIENISNRFPNIKIKTLNITSDNNTLNIIFSYFVINTNIEDDLQITLNNDN
jgi:phage baseplate assembly protein W